MTQAFINVTLVILSEDLDARIAGGNRVVSPTRTFILDASLSRDPDYTASADEGGIALVSSVFKYRWEFQKVATDAAAAAAASVEGSPDELMATIEAAQPTLTVDPKELGLEAGTAYSVTLSLFSARFRVGVPEGNATDSTSVIITLAQESVPVVFITSTFPADPTYAIEELGIWIRCEASQPDRPESSADDLVFVWSSADGDETIANISRYVRRSQYYLNATSDLEQSVEGLDPVQLKSSVLDILGIGSRSIAVTDSDGDLEASLAAIGNTAVTISDILDSYIGAGTDTAYRTVSHLDRDPDSTKSARFADSDFFDNTFSH
eukprot:tig00020686_g12845.t1